MYGAFLREPLESIGATLTAQKVPIKWESVDVTPRLKDGKTVIPDEAIDSVTKNYVALKGPLAVRPTSGLIYISALTYLDPRWQGPRLAQPDSAPHI